MSLESVFVSLILGLITSVMGTYIYDNIFRNKQYEPAYLFSEKFLFVKNSKKNRIQGDKRKSNRQLAFDVFFVVFIMYLIWASLYIPLVIKAGIIQNTVDLSNSNFVHIFGVSKEDLVFSLDSLKWVCLLMSIFLFFPALYIGTFFSRFFAHFKDQFYELTQRDWKIYRLYGIMIFITLLLAVEIYLISSMPFWNSLILATVVVVGFIVKANEKQ
ncbi:MAG: hypothetical protein RBR54_06005 [Sulfurimonas sp.]|jgi:hypothetical protein|nr:hypothetical protein [Sulfurimonas sp.]